MQSFLDLCAEHLLRHYHDSMAEALVILPTRRSGLVLQAHLEQQKAPALPAIIPIEDFIWQTSGFERPSAVLLLLELYEVFRQRDPQLRLELFTGWGHILLRDFDTLDRNLVEATTLFQNLSDIKNLERWNIEASEISPKIREYFQLWENLSPVYHEFKDRLLAKNQMYAGGAYRYLAENATQKLVQHPNYRFFILLGFNALSKAEEKMFKALLDAQKAEIIWDADRYYMQEGTENKAGQFLRRYEKKWVGTNWKFQSNDLAESEKDILVIRTANASMQGKVANQLLRQLCPNPLEAPLPPTALVLADETLLLPVLHSLDPQFEGLNVCIGLSLRDSALFTLIDILFEQQQMLLYDRELQQHRFSHRTVVKLLSHPFLRQYEKRLGLHPSEDENRSLLLMFVYAINRYNLIFLLPEEIPNILEHEELKAQRAEDTSLEEYYQEMRPRWQPLFSQLFCHWQNTFEAIEGLEKITELLYHEENYLEAAYFGEFRKVLQQLRGFAAQKGPRIDLRTFRIFLYQALREARFDFDRNHQSTLELMGINETRNLDFDHVIMLSVNETVLPRSKRVHSFIPLDIAKAYELPTYAEQDAVVSYHFYRLLQRAKSLTLVYVAPSDTYGAKEKSRFILQIENDLRRYNPKIRFREIPARLKTVAAPTAPGIAYQKTEAHQQQIRALLQEGLSPSHINSFIHCSLQFYFREIAQIGQSAAVEERLGADKQGVLVHEVLEDIFNDLTQASPFVHAEDLEKIIPQVESRVANKFQLERYVHYLLTGQNFIVQQVVAQQVRQFLRQQIAECQALNAPFEILRLENQDVSQEEKPRARHEFAAEWLIALNRESLPLRLKGVVDRIDRIPGKVRIIDYKTGQVKKEDLKVKNQDLALLVQDPKQKNVRQLWLYKLIATRQLLARGKIETGSQAIEAHEMIVGGIYSMRNLEEGWLEIQTASAQESLLPTDIDDFVKVSDKYLGLIIENMLDLTQAFAQTDDEKYCQYCNYKNICGR
ncbi:MAG: PD-(D/E)XK nuclease family protein [Microscillaceae bacterium]